MHVGARRHILQVRDEELAAGRRGAAERLWLLGEDGGPVRLVRTRGIDEDDAAIGRAPVTMILVSDTLKL